MTENIDNFKNSHIFQHVCVLFQGSNNRRTGSYFLGTRKGSSLDTNTEAGNCWYNSKDSFLFPSRVLGLTPASSVLFSDL